MNGRLIRDVVEIDSETGYKYLTVVHEALLIFLYACLLIDLLIHAFDCFFWLNIESDSSTCEVVLDKYLKTIFSLWELTGLVDDFRLAENNSGAEH